MIMTRRITLLCAALAFSAQAALAAPDNPPVKPDSNYKVGDTLPQAKPSAAASGDYNEILWAWLLPDNWDPDDQLAQLNLNELSDNDPKARDVLKKIKEMWDSAPVNPKIDNLRVRIPGFAVPLDGDRDQVREFLLVPYFGACIHAPPPPANQIIHVVVPKGAKDLKVMSTVWVSGTIRTVQSDTKMGSSGYELRADIVAPYKLEYTPF